VIINRSELNLLSHGFSDEKCFRNILTRMILQVVNKLSNLQKQVYSYSIRSSLLSTAPSTMSQFKFDKPNFPRRPPKNRPEPTLRNGRTLAWMCLALLATVAAPKIINDIIAIFDDSGEDGKSESTKE